MSTTKKKSGRRIKEENFSLNGFFKEIKDKRIIEILAGFIGGGWLLLEFVHWILIDHYHFPEQILDITLITLTGMLLFTLSWRLLKNKFAILTSILIASSLFYANARLIKEIIKEKPREERTEKTKWKNSIAVLPFADISPKKDHEYFCDGLTEEIINALSNVQELKVVARTSAFSFKNKNMDIREIGRKLNVSTILEGSVRKAGNRLRVTVQLINVADGYHLWSEEFERTMRDVFAVQDEIALAILQKLKVKLLKSEKEKITKIPTKNLQAYNFYLKGRWFWNQRNEASLNRAIVNLKKSIELDPDFALAYAALADVYLVYPDYSSVSPLPYLKNARKMAEKAIKLNKSFAQPYATLAMIKLSDWEWEEAEKKLKKALALNFNYSTAHLWYGQLWMFKGELDKALKEVNKALELNPLSTTANRAKGIIYYFAKKYDLAIQQLRKTLELDPYMLWVHLYMALSLSQKGMFEKALEEYYKEPSSVKTKNLKLTMLGIIYVQMGEKKKALQILDEVIKRSRQEYVPYSFIASLCVALGKEELGLNYLELAYEKKDNWLKYIKLPVFLNPVRSHPRYLRLLKKIRLL